MVLPVFILLCGLQVEPAPGETAENHEAGKCSLIVGGPGCSGTGAGQGIANRFGGHGDAQFLVFVLQLVQAVINAALCEEFLVRALLAQAALVKYEDAIGVLYGAQAVCDDNGGAAGKQPIERRANHQLGAGVHAGGGFIKDQKLGIVGQGPRETHQLALAY